MKVCPGSAIPAFRRHATIHLIKMQLIIPQKSFILHYNTSVSKATNASMISAEIRNKKADENLD
jgi:hypothetical protein